MTSVTQIRVLTINAGQNSETTLYRLQKGWNLRFLLGPTLHTATVRLFCNHPNRSNEDFDRMVYHEVPWKSPTGMKSDRHDIYADVSIVIAGSFNFFFTTDQSHTPENANGHGFFLVDPKLAVGASDEEISLDCLQCQTVVTKMLGPFHEWEGRLLVAKETGYNLIHFTPVQELGISNSAYSIRDQRHLSPVYGKNCTYKDLDALVKRMTREWEVLSLTDLVYNHTAIDSPWIQEHPECAFNLENSPHLRPGYVMDRTLLEFSDQVSAGKWESHGIPAHIETEGHLQNVASILLHDVLPKQKFYEFWCVDIENSIKEFKKQIEGNIVATTKDKTLVIKQDHLYRRRKSFVDMNAALRIFNIDQPGVFSREERINKCCDLLRDKLVELNGMKEREMQDHIHTAVKNYVANGRWRFIDGNGPKLKKVTKDHPIMHEYFVWPPSHSGSVKVAEKMMDGEEKFVMAVNGWVMNDDPLKSFAEEGSNVYFRRELIEWGDSVKLRYGKSPADCPYLWKHMTEYTQITAKIFHGIRLDNCHSTPIHVAEYMLDAARKIRPDLYVVAELFTGGEHLDNIFINRLGINSLIRESMSAWDAHEEVRLVHRYGGIPVGSFVQPHIRPLVPAVAHALFFDQTHDNPSPIEKRSAYDLWPSTALVSMACCASGSNRGYDELVPHHIHIVQDKRLYTSWGTKDNLQDSYINETHGIIAGKKLLNNLHLEMGKNGFHEIYIDQLDGDVVSVTRHNPQTHQSIVLVMRTSFHEPDKPDETGYIKSIIIQGVVEEIILQGRMRKDPNLTFKQNPNYINGLPDFSLELKTHLRIEESEMLKVTPLDKTMEVSFIDFTPGSVIAFRTTLPKESHQAILEIRRGLAQFGYLMRSYSGATTFDGKFEQSNFRAIVSCLTLGDLNVVLYRSQPEEESDQCGSGVYDIPEFGPMVYCGLRGIISVLADIRPTNDLGHPLCRNLRAGPWLPDYVANRLLLHDATVNLGHWFEGVFKNLKNVPPYLVPCYFDAIITGAYVVIREMAIQQLSGFIKEGSTFVQALAMGSVQFCGFVKNAKLPPLPKNHDPPLRTEKDLNTGNEYVAPLSLAAGFPHFSSGYMRNWGRDTFISAHGLLVLPGRFEELRIMILSYGGTLRHGLIPNLLNEGTGSRYNCRDAIWWWLQCVKDYCKKAPNGLELLQDKVTRMYPTDDSEPKMGDQNVQKLCDVIQEALQKHAHGMRFVERNAGYEIDSEMTEPGFTVEVGVKWDTGFVYGGNEHNCGTWMDKMGSSGKAGNKGNPATPRDGSAVELVGLSMSALSWLGEICEQGMYPYKSVKAVRNGVETEVTFNEWSNKIATNFEKSFWINTTPKPEFEPAPELISRRGMYKDSFCATRYWADYQLRPNFPIAMVVAPELFTPERAWTALNLVEEYLLGPVGMKTLDPADWSYRGYYDNDNDSEDAKIAKGFSYHQGPEWVWPIGFFLRAKLYFASVLEKNQPGILHKTMQFVGSTLARHHKEIMESPWQSLPEMTNANGDYCPFSCRAQAWSVSCVLDVVYDLETLHDTENPKKC